jgi:hypothetical protein
VAASFEGWQKVLVAGTAGLLAANLPNTIKIYGSHPMVAALGVYDPQSGAVNIDALYNAYVPKLGNDKIPIPIPKVGTIRMGQPEIDLLMRYIKEA